MADELSRFFRAVAGVASTAEVASLLGVHEGTARAFARENDIRRIGASFAFNEQDARELGAEVGALDEEGYLANPDDERDGGDESDEDDLDGDDVNDDEEEEDDDEGLDANEEDDE